MTPILRGAAGRQGARLDVRGLTVRMPGGATRLDRASFTIEPGELVAIVGGSGAGKTTLLDALAGIRPADHGQVLVDRADLYADPGAFRTSVGYVPQDDILHTELSVESTLRYAARLRLGGTVLGELEERVAETLSALGLDDRRHVPVASLSGGQRKRASIAVELLSRPRLFFLDEPTSGLDPATAAELVPVLRRLAVTGATVVFTTHSVHDLEHCDRIVFVARGGRIAFVGTRDAALAHFDVERVEDVYLLLAREAAPDAGRAPEPDSAPVPHALHPAPSAPPRPGPVQQWATLTRRTLDTIIHNRLTLAILLGAPVMIVAMFAVLFRPRPFDPTDPSPTTIVMILFWVTFAAFFFGLTYGLLQVCTEQAVVRREYFVGLRLGAYVLSKVAVLLPFLVFVNVLMLVVLRALDRLPPADLATYAGVGVTLTLTAAVALMLGLLTSAAVANPAQATLALPMLCFPAVLFSGAILPVHQMATAGAVISAAMPNRWSFEAVGHDLGVRALLEHGGSPLGPPLIAAYGDAGMRSTGFYWGLLLLFGAVFTAGAVAAVQRRCRPPR